MWKPLEETTSAEWDRTFAVNVRAAACLSAGVLPGMQARRFGRIINIASEAGHYLTSGYYEHWLTAAATLAVEHGLVTGSELEARAGGRFPLSGPVLAPPVVDAGPDVGTPRFGVGDRVRVREWHPPGHTRCPRYVRGKAGTVVRLDGIYSVPDIEAHGSARRHEPTYSVRFDAAELWGDGQRGVRVHVDLWDSYLEPS